MAPPPSAALPAWTPPSAALPPRRRPRVAPALGGRPARAAPQPSATGPPQAPGGEFFGGRPRGLHASTPHPAAGQGSLEYVGLLTLVGAVLAAAGPVAGLPGGGGGGRARGPDRDLHRRRRRVPDRRRAARRGWRPARCPTAGAAAGGAVTIMSAEARRAPPLDGRAAVRRLGAGHARRRRAAGVSGGIGFEYGALRLGRRREPLVHGRRAAATWEFPDAATAGRFLAEVERGGPVDTERWPPAWRFGDAGAVAEASAGLGVHLGGDGRRRRRRGRRRGVVRDGDGRARRPRADDDLPAHGDRAARSSRIRSGTPPAAAPVGPVVAEYTRDRSGPRELAFRAATPGSAAGRGGRDRRPAGPPRSREPRRRRPAAARPRAVAARDPRRPASR